MALVLTRTIVVGSTPTTFHAFPSEPIEAETTDDRGRNVVVSFTDVAGNPITVRTADTLEEVATLTSSPVNGRLPSFYAAQGIVRMVTSVDAQFRTAPGYLNLQEALAEALARAEAVERKLDEYLEQPVYASAVMMSTGEVMPVRGLYEGESDAGIPRPAYVLVAKR